MRNPLLLPALALAAGIVGERLVPTSPAITGWASLSLVAIAFVALMFRAARVYVRIAMLLATCGAGAFTMAWNRTGVAPSLNAESGDRILLEGCVVEPPAVRDDSESVTVDLGGDARVRLLFREPGSGLRYGQRIEVPAKIRYPHNFRNEGDFDVVRWLQRQHIYWNATASKANLHVIPGECGTRVQEWLFSIRSGVSERVAQLYRGDEYKTSLLQALLIGDTARMQKVWTDDYRRTGTYHALVISGLHISVLAGAGLFLMRICFVPRSVAMPITALLAWVYALASGAQAPVTRSAAGFTLFLVARFFYRQGRILNLLALVAIAFLAWDPEQLFEPSFQLSFLAVAALGALAMPWMEYVTAPLLAASRRLENDQIDVHFRREHAVIRVELRLVAETLSFVTRASVDRCARFVTMGVRIAVFITDSFITSLCAQIGLALPMIYYFHRVSISGILANLIIVPLLNLAVVSGFAAVATGLHPFVWSTGLLIDWSHAVTAWHANWEPNWRMPDPPLWLAVAFALSLLSLAAFRRLRKTSLVGVAACLTAACGYSSAPRSTPRFELTAIDVGQGDSLLAIFPDGKTMLVDSGGFPVFGKQKRRSSLDAGEDVVSPYLWSRGIRTIDTLVSTHGHEDHSGGLAAIVRNFHPFEIWAGGSPPIAGVHAKALHAGAPFAYGGATVQVLAPQPDYVPREQAMNDDSLVLLVVYGQHRFLLTGDATPLIESGMLATGALPPVDVLKVAHHGSKHSSTQDFLAAARPHLALLSVGIDNIYGLPSAQTIDRLRAHGVTILRTDQHGRSTIISDGRHLSFDTYSWKENWTRYTPF